MSAGAHFQGKGTALPGKQDPTSQLGLQGLPVLGRGGKEITWFLATVRPESCSVTRTSEQSMKAAPTAPGHLVV